MGNVAPAPANKSVKKGMERRQKIRELAERWDEFADPLLYSDYFRQLKSGYFLS